MPKSAFPPNFNLKYHTLYGSKEYLDCTEIETISNHIFLKLSIDFTALLDSHFKFHKYTSAFFVVSC